MKTAFEPAFTIHECLSYPSPFRCVCRVVLHVHCSLWHHITKNNVILLLTLLSFSSNFPLHRFRVLRVLIALNELVHLALKTLCGRSADFIGSSQF
jgi:hypothetical protein